MNDVTGKVFVYTSSDALITRLEAFAAPLLTDLGMELVEIQFRREGQGWVLRLFIDKQGGITVDDCAGVSREISAYLEVEDCIDHAYVLEVSSPGLERPLKRPQDFTRFAGRKVRIKLRQDSGMGKVLVGTLQGLEGDEVVLLVDNTKLTLHREQISRARLTLD
ncbi:MAG: ribosome maturation factor RimP [bacterium]|nr:ribosome maturation factor RimP [bacterium]